MAEPSPLPEPPDDTERTRARIAARIAAQQQADRARADLAAKKAAYTAVPTVAELIASSKFTPGGGSFRSRTSNPTEGQEYTGTSNDSEAIVPKPQAPNKKPQKATGPTGPPRPTAPTPTAPTRSGLGNPALENFGKQIDDMAQQPDWRDRAAAQAESIQNQFLGPPQMVGYKWFAGTGGLQGGNDAGMIAHFSDGSSRWVNTSVPGEIPQPPPTTEQTQQGMLEQGQVTGQGGGILPAWNSPTGRNEDLKNYGPIIGDTSLGGPIPPSGWLNSAISAARGGASTYDTGSTSPDQYGKGQIGTSPIGRQFISTPSGGTMSLPNSGALREGIDTAVHGIKTSMEDRSALFNKITQSNLTPPTLNVPKHEEWDSSQSGGNYGG